jgi:PAS domain S-box-containing protein
LKSENQIKALIVEDNPTQANMLRISLTRRGFEVEAVAYLAHAVDRLGRGGIDVVLLDLSLPDSDGIDTFYEIYNRASEVPIVVLSGMNDHAVAQAALEGGAQDYLVKGVPSDESISRCLRYAIERHRFERKIWESERTTRLIIENAQDAFVSMDAQGRVTGWNIKAEMVFGWYRKDVIGMPLLDVLFPENTRNFFFQEIQAFLSGQRGNLVNNRVETTLVRKDGSYFPAELAMFPVTVGSAYTLGGFVQDISDRKLVEQRLHQTNLQLEVLVNDRTAELNETIGELQQFARQTARELQEPLVTLQAAALSLEKELRETNNPLIEEKLDKILELANHMVSNLQLLKEHKLDGSGGGSGKDGRNGKDGNGSIARTAPTLREHPALNPPPIAQIKLPDQMVPTSNVTPHIINTNPRSTKVLPAIKGTVGNGATGNGNTGNAKTGPKITKILPAIERPTPDSNPQKKMN